VPLVYNFVETGKSPLLRASELERLGFRIVIFPASALLAVHKVVEELMRDLRRDGTTAGWLRRMKTLRESFELVGLSEHVAKAEAVSPKK